MGKTTKSELSLPLTRIRVRFGASGFWIEDSTTPLPYGTILTELLDFPAEPYFRVLRVLEQAMNSGSGETAARAFRQLVDAFLTLPLYNRLGQVDKLRLEPTLLFRDTELGMMLAADGGRILEKYRMAQEDLSLIQTRYVWFLDQLGRGMESEKKKGRRKDSPAGRLCRQGLDGLVSRADLGDERFSIEPPQVSIRYEVLNIGGRPELTELLYFDRLADFVYVELMRGLQRGYLPKRCLNCGRWFLQQPGSDFHYCPRVAPGELEKTCREVGALSSFQAKVRNSEIWQLHQRAYKKYFARTRTGTLSRDDFDSWARQAESLRDRALEAYDRADAGERKRIAEELRAQLNQL